MNAMERYTLERDVRLGAWLTGLQWDAADPKSIFYMDAAAHAESHWSPRYYDIATNGLTSPWFGSVWLNPPFTKLYEWTKRIWQAANEPAVTSVTYYIPGDRIEQPFWHEFIEPFRDGRDRQGAPFQLDTHMQKGRAPFGHPGNVTGAGVGSPPFKMAFLIFRRREPGQVLPVPRLEDCPLLKAAP